MDEFVKDEVKKSKHMLKVDVKTCPLTVTCYTDLANLGNGVAYLSVTCVFVCDVGVMWLHA